MHRLLSLYPCSSGRLGFSCPHTHVIDNRLRASTPGSGTSARSDRYLRRLRYQIEPGLEELGARHRREGDVPDHDSPDGSLRHQP
jgi:hypothetical protein